MIEVIGSRLCLEFTRFFASSTFDVQFIPFHFLFFLPSAKEMATSTELAAFSSAAKTTKSPTMLADASKTLAWNLHVDMLKQNNASENYVLSPYSMSTAFGMALLGARETTYEEMVSALSLPANVVQEDLIKAYRVAQDSIQSAVGMDNERSRRKGSESDDDEEPSQSASSSSSKRPREPKGPPPLQLDTAVKLYVQQDIGLVRQDYLDKLRRAFSIEAFEEVDMKNSAEKVCKQINAFVEKTTRGKIRKVVNSFHPDDKLILVNAVYLKAKWAGKFEKRNTVEQGKFYVAHEKRWRNDVPMMRKCQSLQYAENKAAQFVWLPYKGREVQMVIAVPKERDGGLSALQAAVSSAGGLNTMLKSKVKFERGVKVDLSLPRFKVESTVVLNDIMQRLGMIKAFGKESADFSGMMVGKLEVGPIWICIGKALQKVIIEVDEEGTEAAAATVVHVRSGARCSAPTPRIVKVKADKPFMYWIEHVDTGLVLFSGVVANP